jgi:two-component system, chemotaxis family, response regulator Rcp1
MPEAREHNLIEILLVEDSPSDAELMVEALNEGKLNTRITVVDDGVEAMEYLHRCGKSQPDLILLDLHLPRMSGHEVLAEVKKDPLLLRIPIIVLTSSDNEQAFLDAYDLHANCCVSKPVDQEQFSRAVMKIEHFWLHVARRK